VTAKFNTMTNINLLFYGNKALFAVEVPQKVFILFFSLSLSLSLYLFSPLPNPQTTSVKPKKNQLVLRFGPIFLFPTNHLEIYLQSREEESLSRATHSKYIWVILYLSIYLVDG